MDGRKELTRRTDGSLISGLQMEPVYLRQKAEAVTAPTRKIPNPTSRPAIKAPAHTHADDCQVGVQELYVRLLCIHGNNKLGCLCCAPVCWSRHRSRPRAACSGSARSTLAPGCSTLCFYAGSPA